MLIIETQSKAFPIDINRVILIKIILQQFVLSTRLQVMKDLSLPSSDFLKTSTKLCFVIVKFATTSAKIAAAEHIIYCQYESQRNLMTCCQLKQNDIIRHNICQDQ